jgi:Cu(I)/Ag(I) efflux system membrane fusion protein
MTSDPSANDSAVSPVEAAELNAPSWGAGRRLALAARAVQVRLRFIVVLLVAFLVIGLWGNLRNYWDTLTHTFTGSHVGQQAISADTEYFCPMDPGVISDWPAVCPVCNMDLVRRKKGEAAMLPEGVVARMQFSPYRIQLAGIKTSVVARRALTREIDVAGQLIDAAATRADSDANPAGPAEPERKFFLACETSVGDHSLLTIGRQAVISIEGLPRVKPLVGTITAARELSVNGSGRRLLAVEIAVQDPDPDLRAGQFGSARVSVPLVESEPRPSSSTPARKALAEGVVAVPETAVVDTGSRRVVFVESMPGMFDGVEVTLGPRCGDYFPVLTGLEPGQRVATVGAFLIDAEARLSPNLAAGYFGAARTAETASQAPVVAKSTDKPSRKKAAAKLSAADQQLVRKQKVCPVTDLPLDSMGGPVAVEVLGEKVFICCKGCESKLKNDPQKYLAKLKK